MNINKKIAVIVAQTETVIAAWNKWVESPTVFNRNRFVDATRNVSITLNQIEPYETHALMAGKAIGVVSMAAAWEIRAFNNAKVQESMRSFIGHVKVLKSK